MITRYIDKDLINWKQSEERKVLLVRGARQVGKTFSIRELAKSFDSFIEVNFLETSELKQLFRTGSLDPKGIIEKLQAYFGITLIPGKSLLFFDEIQECPEALTALRFFYEKIPQLHVIATGSLLEFVLSEIPSFGVGRIDSLFLYPLCLEEFFIATGNGSLLNAVFEASPQNPLDGVLHNKALEIFKTFTLIGGFPAAVQSYVSTRDINQSLSIISGILVGYEDDFAKYKTRISSEKLRQTLQAVAKQTGSKFVYSHINPGGSSSGYDQALELLQQAGLVYKICHTGANGIPLGAQADPRNFKAIPLDVGFYNVLLGLNLSEIVVQDPTTFVNNGVLAEIICGTELIARTATRKQELYCWRRQAKNSNAEVDYVVQKHSEIIPIEVKGGTKGQMQSLYLFLSNKKKKLGVRTSLENFSYYTSPDGQAKIEVVPLYSISSYLNN